MRLHPDSLTYAYDYCHSDHLGSASYITDLDGQIVQHIEYIPFGEIFLEERNNQWNTPYLFNSKELDDKIRRSGFVNTYKKQLKNSEQTGLYYYGARYYDARVSQWLSVDPLAEIAPDKSPYHYCSNNPINRIDPSGLTDYTVNGETRRTIKDGHNDVKINVTEKQFNRLQRKFDRGGSGYERMMNRISLENGFTTTSHGEGYVDEDGTEVLPSTILTFHKAGKHSYADWSAQGGGGDLSGTDKAGYGLNAFGFANGAKTELIDYAVRSGSSQAGIRAELQVLGKTGTRYLSAAKGLGFMAGVAGVAVTGIDAYNKGQWQNHHTADVLIGVGSLYLLTGPVGWAVGGGYFLLDVGIKSYTGKSITENLFDKP